MPRLLDVNVKARPPITATKTLTIDATVASVLRKVARVDGLKMSDFLDRALRAYIDQVHPDWELVEDGDQPVGDVPTKRKKATGSKAQRR